MAAIIDVQDDSLALIVVCRNCSFICSFAFVGEAKFTNRAPNEIVIGRVSTVGFQPLVECLGSGFGSINGLVTVIDDHRHAGNQAASLADCFGTIPVGVTTPAGVTLLVQRVCS